MVEAGYKEQAMVKAEVFFIGDDEEVGSDEIEKDGKAEANKVEDDKTLKEAETCFKHCDEIVKKADREFPRLVTLNIDGEKVAVKDEMAKKKKKRKKRKTAKDTGLTLEEMVRQQIEAGELD